MGYIFFVAILLMLVFDSIGLKVLKSKYPKKYKELGSPVHYWTGASKIAYLLGYIVPLRFLSLSDIKLKIILSIQAVSFWFCMCYVLFNYYQRIQAI